MRDLSTPLAVATRRSFMQKVVVAGGVAAAGVASLGKILPALAADPVTDFAHAAVGAERIGIAFYGNALGMATDFSAPGDPAVTSLLNSSHRGYFEAALNQETSHLATLQSLGAAFPFSTFAFPAGTFATRGAMLAMGAALESIFIGAYLGAVKAAASSTNAFIAAAAAQICGIECEHRVLINDIMAVSPPNDRFYEGDLGGPTSTLGNTGKRSTVYGSAGGAVNALLALGITPS